MATSKTGMGVEERPSFVARHKPSAVVLASQVSAAVVHGVVKTLENGPDAVNPFQILIVRMAITGIGCSLYLRHQKVPEFPLGQREVRPLLMLRAVGGILGAGGMFYSIKYLTLSQATALNFLAPLGAMILSKYVDNGNFGFIDRAGAFIALAGVMMIVQPENLFQPGETLPLGSGPETYTKLKGLGFGVVGIIGTVTALTTVRHIGPRAHPLTIVNYFAWVVFLAATALVVIEQISWPTSLWTWGYMTLVGVFGGLMEFLLTVGISSDKSSVATIMIYSQVLWALLLDQIFWHVSMNAWSFVGVGNVIGSLILVSLAKEISPYRQHAGEQDYEAGLAYEENDIITHDLGLNSLYVPEVTRGYR